MKNLLLFIFIICFVLTNAYGQKQEVNSVQLSLVKKSDNRLSEHTHYYEFLISNTSKNEIECVVANRTIACKNKNTTLTTEALNTHQQRVEFVSILPNQSFSFKLKLSRNHLTELNSWYCSEVFILNPKGDIISNTLNLSHFIPNPKNFN